MARQARGRVRDEKRPRANRRASPDEEVERLIEKATKYAKEELEILVGSPGNAEKVVALALKLKRLTSDAAPEEDGDGEFDLGL